MLVETVVVTFFLHVRLLRVFNKETVLQLAKVGAFF